MTIKVVIVILALSSCFCVVYGKNKNIKGLYCKDPDTNVLHTINTTWPSTTFCGNYTCKTRAVKKNEIEIVTNIDKKKSNTSELMQAENTNTAEKRIVLGKPKEIYEKIIKPKTNSGDRYLNKDEIKEIAGILSNVKISDLEALFELYSAAKEVYEEMDTNNSKKTQRINDLITNSHKNIHRGDFTYWYDPHYNLKNIKVLDLKTDGINVNNLHKHVMANRPLYYFNGALSSADFGKLPYYYPLSAFQRLSSYIHDSKLQQRYNVIVPKPVPTVAPIVPTEYPPNAEPNTFPPAYKPIHYNLPIPRTVPHTVIHENNPSPLKQSTITNREKLTNLLAFPYTNMQRINGFNFQKPPYFRNNPWMEFLPTKHHKPNLVPRGPKAYPNMPVANNIAARLTGMHTLLNPEIEDIIETIEQKPLMEERINTERSIDNKLQRPPLPSWKTEDLAPEVIEDIRANVLDRNNDLLLKPFPLKRSKIKLENLGKILKLDKLRRKRSVEDNIDELSDKDTDVYEAYVEKTVCKTDQNIGFFSVGNSSQLYPQCCPQRIDPTTLTETPRTA